MWEVRNVLMKMSYCHLRPDVRVRIVDKDQDLVWDPEKDIELTPPLPGCRNQKRGPYTSSLQCNRSEPVLRSTHKLPLRA